MRSKLAEGNADSLQDSQKLADDNERMRQQADELQEQIDLAAEN